MYSIDLLNKNFFIRNKVSVYRKKIGLTQSELAELCSVSKNTISSIETGVFCPSLKLTFKLLCIFECTLNDLFYFE